MNNDSDSPQGQAGVQQPCEHVCPDCGVTFNDGTDYEDGDCCMRCTEQWLEKNKQVIMKVAQMIRAKRGLAT